HRRPGRRHRPAGPARRPAAAPGTVTAPPTRPRRAKKPRRSAKPRRGRIRCPPPTSARRGDTLSITNSATKSSPEANGQHASNGQALPLLPQHLQDLRASGLSDATIEVCGFISTDKPDVIGQLLNWRSAAADLGPCLVIPFRRPDGPPIPLAEFCRLKPDKPRTRDGRPVKYEQPVGKPLHAYFPPGTIAALADPARPLIVTEGEKKAAAADQAGFPVVGL